MHDFDVGAISLSVPPASAVIQSYRPAVLVRNNGVHDALASGSLRIYSPAGLLIFTTEVYSGTIAPGETAPAQAVAYWTPPALGRYMFIAYVSCINDQYENNNSLAPCFVDVIPGEPLPPSAVPLHAAQHEEGGQDELNIDGLHGRATDSQTPLAHKTSHQVAGSDTLDLTGMLGVLGTPQPIADHHETHENSGGDELNVEGLYGVLENLQKPKVHANEAHDPNYATSLELSNHLADTTAVHTVATNLEQKANKTEANGYPSLNANALIPVEQLGTGAAASGTFLKGDNTWGNPAIPAGLLATETSGQLFVNFSRGHILAGANANLCPISVPGALNGTLKLKAWGRLSTVTAGSLTAQLHAHGLTPGDETISEIAGLPIAAGSTDLPILLEAEITASDMYVDGWLKVTVGTQHPHLLPATVRVDSYYQTILNNRTPATPLVCHVNVAVDNFLGSDFYIHWQTVNLSKA
jgi:hypothetical protein